MSMSHKASNLALHNRVCSIPEGGILFHFDNGLHGIDSAGNIICPKEGAVATLRPNEGRFGGAVAVEEGTTNLLDESFSNGSSWLLNGATVNNIDVPGFMWAKEILKTGDESDNTLNRVSIPCAPNTEYTFSVWARVKRGEFRAGDVDIYIGSNSQGNAGVAPYKQIFLTNEWQRFTVTGVTNDSATTITRATFRVMQGANIDVEIADWQLEAKPFATSFVDGSRNLGTLRIEDIPEKNLTVSFWWKSPVMLNRNIGSGQQSYPAIAQIGSYSTNRRSVRLWLWDERLAWFVGHPDTSDWMVRNTSITAKGEIEPDTFYMLTFTLEDGKIIKMYFNGELKTTTTVSRDLDFWEDQKRLSFEPSSSAHNNAWYDELLILPYAATTEEMQSWYHSKAPMHNNLDTYITL